MIGRRGFADALKGWRRGGAKGTTTASELAYDPSAVPPRSRAHPRVFYFDEVINVTLLLPAVWPSSRYTAACTPAREYRRPTGRPVRHLP